MVAFPRKTDDTPKKIQSKVFLSEEAKEQLVLLSRKMVLSQSEVVELLIRNTYTSHVELANIKYIENREQMFKKIIEDLHVIRGEIKEIKGE